MALAINPYFRGDDVPGGSREEVIRTVKAKLEKGGFNVIGTYTPRGLPHHASIIVTDDGILKAIRDIKGASIVGAGIRIGVKDDGMVSYINPDYWYRAYFQDGFRRHQKAVEALNTKLQLILGYKGGFGGDVPAKKIKDYRYSFGLERFRDAYRLNRFPGFGAALKTIRDNLRRGVKQTEKVYEVVMMDEQLAVFGVAMNDPRKGDAAWVSKLIPDHIAAMPYEMYVVKGEAFALHPRFRIAFSWP
ncbi:MAG: hypothetical protein D6819_04555, partial [Gammaproteobacteria bacterium]